MFLRLLLSRPFLLNILVIVFTAGGLHAAPYGPNGLETEWTQPDGTKLSLRVFGDEFYARTETLDGHTVVYSPTDNAYHYAIISNDGQKLIPNGRRVSGKAPAGLAKKLHLPVEARKAVWETRYRKLAPEERANWGKRVQAARQRKEMAAKGPAPQNADGEGSVGGEPAAAASSAAFAPVTGNYVGLTILVQFPDDPATTPAVDPTNFPTTRAKMERYCNELGYTDDGNTGSVRDYFRGQSLNATDYTQVVTEIVTLPQPRNYYNWANYPTNTTIRDGGLTGRLVLNDAITVLKSQGFDFTGLTRNGSNQVIATNVIFAGATSGVWPDGLWPHRWVLSPSVNVGTAGSPIYIYDYQITNAQTAAVPIGTFCHENGHLLLKYPDLYDYGGESEGVGNHCLMGAGNHNNGGKTPGPINGYFKDVSGWSNVVDITTSQFFTAALTSTNNAGYRIRKPGTATEYFLIENRGAGDPWAASAPDKGILIWHIDETVNGNDNQQMTASQHYEVSVEQADGAFDLENGSDRGDATDLFDTTYPNFTDTSLPDAKWWSGSNSGIQIAVLSAAGASMNVRFGLPANTVLVSYPNGGESVYLGSTQSINWGANITGNVKIDLFKGGVLHSVLSANEPNDGTYSWVVSAGLPAGNDYSIRITSVDTPAYLDSSNANFSIIPQPTIADALDTSGLTWSTSGNANWFAQGATTKDGIDAAESGNIADSQNSTMETTLIGPGTMTFWWKVSSESGWDYLLFYLNNVEQTGSLAKIAGEVDWIQKTVTIPAGSQTVKWTYSKDSSVDAGADTAWVDQVVYTPSTAPEIAVEQPLNTGLTDGTASISCGSANLGSSASAVTFTLKNVGTADLTGLSISKDGTHNADFTVGSLGATTLAPTATTSFTVTFTPGAAGARTTAIHIASNDANENPFDISLTGFGVGPGTLAVTPAGDLTASGNFGGPFTPSSLQYTLNNPGGTSIDWTAANTESWVTLDSTSGTLAAGASTTVTASINTANANTLNIGSYSDTVTFTNTTSGTGNTTRGVSLTVNPIPATVNLGNLQQTYDGFLKPVTVTTTPSGLAHSVTYNGSSTVPTNGGTYAVVATITEPNYTGSASGNLVISYTVTYQGNGNTSGTVPAAQTKFHDVNLTLANNSGNLNKTDFSFSEWNTAADGSGTDYPAGGTYSGNASLILYAQWVPGAHGTWIQTAAGPFNWGDSANWSGGTVAAGADRTASFTPNITAAQTVNLESARTIGNITFTDSTTASHDLTISGANTLTLARTSGTPTINVTNRTLTISSVIAGSNGLQKSGAGTLVFGSSSNNTFTGGFEINAGTVQYESTTSANAWGNSSNVITFSGTSSLHNNNNAYSLARAITINGGVTASLTGAFGETTNVTGVVGGTGALKVEGFSNGWALTLSNTANTFTGPIQILNSSGTSSLSVASLGSSANAITLSNTGNVGTFTYTGSAAVSRPFVMAGTTGGSTINASGVGALTASSFSVTGAGVKTLTLDGSSSATNQISGNIVNNTGNTSVTKTGSGTWALGGTNSYSGDTNLAASGTTGILIFQGSQALSASTTLKFAQNSSSVQSVRLLDNGTGTINFNRPIEFGGNNTSQNLNIAVGNNHTNNGGSGSGTTTGSTIQVGNITFTSTAADTATTTLNATSPNSNGYRLQTGTITLNNLVTRTAGSTTVTVLNPTTANMTVAAITMAAGNTGIGSDGVPVLRLDGTATDNIVTGNVTNASDYLTGQALSLQKQGSGNWALNGTGNNFTGTITFTGTTASGGKLSFASASGTNPITFNATTGFGSTLTYTGASPLTMSGLITASALTTGGILFEANGTVPTATINYSNASSLSTASTSTGTRFITFGGSNTGDNIFAGAINNNTGVNGNAQVAKVDAGKWILTGNGNYTGGMFINNGTVSVNSLPNGGSNSPLGANTRINLGRDNTTATLIYTGGGNTTNRDLRLGGPSAASGTGGSTILNDGTGALVFTAATFNISQTGILFNRTLTLGGNYTGAANEIQGIIQNNTASTGLVNLDKTGASTWKLSGANTYTGTTTVSAGTLELGANNVLPNASAISIADATLNAATFTDSAATLDVTGTATLNLGAGAALAFANSSSVDWTGGTLNITGTFVSGSSLRFGTGSTGLSSAQLALISTPGGGPVALDSNGYLVSVPTITLTGAPIVAVDTTYGIPSPTPTRFSISAISLTPATGDLTVAALSGFEYSTSVGGTFTATLLIPYTGGALSSTDVFVRLAANISVAGSPYSGNISVSGGGATPQTIATISSTVSKAAPTVTVTVGSYTYNGSAQGPTAYTTNPTGDTGTPTWSYEGTGGTTYGPSTSRPTNAGNYTATVVLAADNNFDAASSSATAFTIANGDLYQAWAGAAAFDSDANNDGVDNGIAWLLGATDPSTNAVSLLPTFDNTSDPEYFIYTYRRSDSANSSPNITIAVQYGSGLSGWSTVAPGPDIIITPTDNFYGTSPGVDKVEVKIKRTLAVESKLFTRLKIDVAP